MRSHSRLLPAITAIACIVLGLDIALARVDVQVDFDKAFNFKRVKTWAWNPGEPGQVKMARTQEDDPEAMRKYAEPIILNAVNGEMGKRGLTAAAAAPDVTVTYYLLLTTSMSTQTIGQFVPATGEWGLPPIPRATQSIKMMNKGSLVLDIAAAGNVVWRGIAQAQIKFDADDKQREQLMREGVHELLRRFPPQ